MKIILTRSALIAGVIGTIGSNFMYQFIHGSGDYLLATERTYFGLFTLFTFWLLSYWLRSENDPLR